MLSCRVFGIPAPQGSKRAFRLPTGRIAMKESSDRVQPWRQEIAGVAAKVVKESSDGPLLGPVRLRATFWFPRPRSHYGTGKRSATVRAGAPARPAVKPDLSKLVRALEDALTGIFYRDDAQIVELSVQKAFGALPGVLVEVEPLG